MFTFSALNWMVECQVGHLILKNSAPYPKGNQANLESGFENGCMNLVCAVY